MSTPETLRRDAELEERELLGELPACPQCHHNTLVTTEFYQATHTDPMCSAGYCACAHSRSCPCEYEWG